MLARTLGTLARYESEHRGERVAAAALQRAQAGGRSGGPRPFGYEDDGITVREPEAKAVRAAVESVLAGASLRSVVRELNKTGLITSMKGRAWDAHSVRAMLLRSRNAGLRDHQGQVIGPANWPEIVPEEQWRAVVTILADPSRRTSSSDSRVRWLGSGLYVCAGCERPSWICRRLRYPQEPSESPWSLSASIRLRARQTSRGMTRALSDIPARHQTSSRDTEDALIMRRGGARQLQAAQASKPHRIGGVRFRFAAAASTAEIRDHF